MVYRRKPVVLLIMVIILLACNLVTGANHPKGEGTRGSEGIGTLPGNPEGVSATLDAFQKTYTAIRNPDTPISSASPQSTKGSRTPTQGAGNVPGAPNKTPSPALATPTHLPTVTNTQAHTPTTRSTPELLDSRSPVLSVGVQAIQVSDDNGKRASLITPDQVAVWVNKANEIYASAGIQFIFNPGQDFSSLNSTLLNNMMSDQDPNWYDEISYGDQVAAGYPGKVMVFFRHGPGRNPDGSGFSWWSYNFVTMPGYGTEVCGMKNPGMLAHEVGHYLGLPHTFTEIFKSQKQAEAYLAEHKNDPNAFDGDGFSDTPPDPFIYTHQMQCQPIQSVTLNSLAFPLPRWDIMSYYEVRTGLSSQQIDRARWILKTRQANSMAMPSNHDAPVQYQAEALPIAAQHRVTTSEQDMSTWDEAQWSEGRQLFCGAERGGALTLWLETVNAGRYQLDLYATHAPDFGIVQVVLDGSNLGVRLDLYAPIVMPTGRIDLGLFDLTQGSHEIQFLVDDKNPASSGYSFGLDVISQTLIP